MELFGLVLLLLLLSFVAMAERLRPSPVVGGMMAESGRWPWSKRGFWSPQARRQGSVVSALLAEHSTWMMALAVTLSPRRTHTRKQHVAEKDAAVACDFVSKLDDCCAAFSEDD